MLTHGQTDFHINYIDPDTHGVRSYYPDFLILTKNDNWLVVEVKARNMMDDRDVLAKQTFAETMLKASKISYHMVAHTDVWGGREFLKTKVDTMKISDIAIKAKDHNRRYGYIHRK